jgi:hypothetical protein
MRVKEMAITKLYRERCKAEIAKENAIIEANYRRGQLEFRAKRRLNNPKWHTEEHTKERERKKALARSEEWTREEFYKEKGFDPDNESNEHIKRDMYLQYERTKRSYGAYGVSPSKASYKSVRSSDSDLLDYNFAHADGQRKLIIDRHVLEASRMRAAVIHDLTGNSPSKKKLRHEIDPDNFQNPFWDNENVIENSEPHRYHDGWTEHDHESNQRLRKMTKSPPKKIVISNVEDEDDEEPNESDNDGKAVMIVSAGDAGEEPVEGGGKAAMIASAGDAGEESVEGDAMIARAGDPDEKALSAASSSSLHTYLTEETDEDLETDDLVDQLIKKAKSKGSKRGGKATSNAVRLSNRPPGKGDIDKECSCGCGRKPSDRNCPGCGSVNSKITMACWMKGQVCQMCQSKDQRKTVV